MKTDPRKKIESNQEKFLSRGSFIGLIPPNKASHKREMLPIGLIYINFCNENFVQSLSSFSKLNSDAICISTASVT